MKKRILSMLLAICMVITLVPAMSFTAFADNKTYSADAFYNADFTSTNNHTKAICAWTYGNTSYIAFTINGEKDVVSAKIGNVSGSAEIFKKTLLINNAKYTSKTVSYLERDLASKEYYIVVSAVGAQLKAQTSVDVKTSAGGFDLDGATISIPDLAKTQITTLTQANVPVTAPVTGAAPQTSVTPTSDSHCTATISWSSTPDKYAAATQYTATLTLTPASGYAFAPNATMNGWTNMGVDAGGKLTLVRTYTTDAAGTVSTSIDADKTAQWSEYGKTATVTTSIASGLTDASGNPMSSQKVLFLGTTCLAHGMKQGTLEKSINALTSSNNEVTYYIFYNNNGGSSGQMVLQKTDTLAPGSTPLSDSESSPFFTYVKSNSHAACANFIEYLYSELVTKGNKYDYIVLEFDSCFLIQEDGISTTHYTMNSDTQCAALHTNYAFKLAGKLQTYYTNNQVIWVTDDKDGGNNKTGNKNFCYSANTPMNKCALNGETQDNTTITPKPQCRTALLLSILDPATYFKKVGTTDNPVAAWRTSKTNTLISFNKPTATYGYSNASTLATNVSTQVNKNNSYKLSITDNVATGLTASNITLQKSSDGGKTWTTDTSVTPSYASGKITATLSNVSGSVQYRLSYTVTAGTGFNSTNSDNPSVGTATATLTLGTATKTATASATLPIHKHSWIYTLSKTVSDNDTITASCTAGCDYTGTDKSLIISASAATYDGSSHGASYAGNPTTIVGGAVPTIYYQKKLADNSYDTETTTAPKNAGTYKASFTIEGKTAYVEYTISPKTVKIKADDKESFAGTDLATLTYTLDTSTPLVSGDGSSITGAPATTADKSTAGTYAITQGTIALSGTNASTNYSISFTAGTYTVKGKSAQTLSFADGNQTKTYGDSKFTKTVTGAATTVTYSSSDESVATVNSSTGEVTILKVGTSVITATAAADSTHNSATETYTLTVNKAKIAVPTANTGLVYNGNEQTGVTLPDGAKYSLSDNKKTAAGSYTATATLTDKTNYEWSGKSSSEDQSISWSIAKAKVAVPTANTGLVYNGNEQTGVTLPSGAKYSLSDNKKTAAGSYSATATLTDKTNYEWSGKSSSEDQSISWSIAKAKVTVPTANTGLVYNGNEQTGVTLPSGALYTLTGNTGTNANSYSATATLTDKTNYEWSGKSSSEDQSISWSIAKAKVTVPTANTGLVYNGNEQTGVTLPSGAKYSLSDNKKTTAGSYSATATLTDKTNYEWNGKSSSEDQSISWSIAKASPVIAVSAKETATTSITLNAIESIYGSAKYAVSSSNTAPTDENKWSTGTSFTGLNPNTTYYFFVKTAGNTNYEAASASASIKTSSHSHDWEYALKQGSDNVLNATCKNTDNNHSGDNTVSLTVAAENAVYDGQPHTASVTGSIPDVSTPGVSYEKYENEQWVSFSGSPTEVGTYRASITLGGVKAYKDYSITPKTTGLTVDDISGSYTYDGNAKTPTLTVKDGTKTLNLGTDYTVAYKNNTNAGTATATVTFKGNYGGTIDKDFTIAKKAATITAKPASKTFGDKDPAFAADVTGLCGSDKLSYSFDRVKGESAKDGENTYAISVSAPKTANGFSNANYDISTVGSTLTIERKSIEGAEIVLAGYALYATGDTVTQEIESITFPGWTDSVTFDVKGNSAKDVGPHSLKITGTGNYTGEVSRIYVILEVPKPKDELEPIEEKNELSIGDNDGLVTLEVKSMSEEMPAGLLMSGSEAINATATAEELHEVATGRTLDIWMEVTPLETVDTEIKESLDNMMAESGKKSACYLDADLFKKFRDEDEATPIHETNKALTVTVTVPEKYRAENKEFAIVRYHNGVSEVISGDYNFETGELVFESRLFSEYALGFEYTGPICTNSSTASGIANGKYEMLLDDKNIGNVEIEKTNGGWYLKLNDEYVGRDGTDLTNSKQVWYFQNNRFYQEQTVEVSRGWTILNLLFGRKKVTNTYYLALVNGEAGINTTGLDSNVEFKTVQALFEHDYTFHPDGHGHHYAACSCCGKKNNIFGSCSYDKFGICTVCGGSDPNSAGLFNIAVKTKMTNLLFFKLYTAQVTASSQLVGIKNVRISNADGLDFTTGVLTSTKPITDVVVVITTYGDDVYAYKYNIPTAHAEKYELM